MLNFTIVVHIVVCIALILIVLLQAGKGSQMGAAFGGSSQTIFGSSGPGNFLEKLTAGAAIVFMLTSLTLAYFSTQRPGSSVTQDDIVPIEENVPTVPPSPESK